MSPYGSQPPVEGGDPVEATVKWFNSTKGFGFVSVPNGSDAFMHASSLLPLGLQNVSEGAKLLVRIGQAAKGRQVTEVIQVLSEGTPQTRSSGGGYGGGGGGGYGGGGGGGYGGGGGGYGGGRDRDSSPPVASGPVESVTGVVKWFKEDKGFGFVATDNGGKDVFVHKSLVQGAGLNSLQTGQRVRMNVQTTSKGREAVALEVLGD